MDPQTEDFLQILQLIDIKKPLNRLGGWAASADFIKLIYKELFKFIEQKKRFTLVECGSGVSTVLLGLFLKKYAPDSMLITLEHDHNYYLQTLAELKMQELDNVKLVHAPLKPYEIDGEIWLWYDDALLSSLATVDVLVIDGPPMATQKDARYPALPLLFPKFSQDAVVLLDDAARDDEKSIVRRWKREFGLLEEFIESEKGTSILRRWNPEKEPLVTIAIATYNRVEFLKEAVASALRQSYKNIEVIVCDDGSDVDVKKELESAFNDKRLKVISNQKNMGRPYTRNRLIEEAGGEYILWLDDDDILEVDTVRKYLKTKEQIAGEIDIFYGNLQMFGDKYTILRPKDFFKNSQLLGYMLFSQPGSPIPNPFVFVKKDVYERFGNYDERFLRAQDYEFWMRNWNRVTVKKVENIVGFYRIHDKNISPFEMTKADRSYESYALRINISSDVFQFAFKNISQKLVFEKIVKLLEDFLDYLNAFYYLSFTDCKEEKRKLAFKIGSLELLKRWSEQDSESEKILKSYKKLLKIVQRGLLSSELVKRIETEFGFSWITFFVNAKFYMQNNREKAYEYARAALLANPFSSESRMLMQELGKDEEAEAIIQRLVPGVNVFEENKRQFFKEYFGE